MYPALLMMTGYGLGLTYSERWSDLHNLLSRVIINRQVQKRRRLVDAVFLKVSPDNDKAIFNNMEGLERHKAPLSTHLFNLFRTWRSDLDGGATDYLPLYARYEAVCSLAAYEGYEETDMVAALDQIKLNRGSGYQGLWMPITGLTWNHDAQTSVLDDLKSGELRDKLVSAGFAHGNPHVINFFLQNLAHLQLYMSYR